ncbi:MAG TPA: flavodoxin domain-containing protein [Candidatus Limnocylindrales bacterium]
MARAAVVYESQTGITRQLAEEIGDFIAQRGIEPNVASIDDCDPASLVEVEYVLLGCWTNGLMIAFQHPTKRWIAWAHRLPPLPSARLGLFTTYKLATGTMFRQMRRELPGLAPPIALELKSRDGHLNDAHRRALAEFVGLTR